ncbi:MAG: hypothetical protein A3F84_08700 [Candidatus Handelsmanbacteria bacterium RIFCSPLOWO2_12_FULL_64_10]|uniref:Uncharacterized protein n=1 Tax=Handelsmanbacteria sp. (strain RIFCSPLOWO2_12_FULL_64_10) TaxID=1817868 RepID=A0A1F6D1H3_HANXR|nr:MAG: hypothetical protein A3F84_08700 [Candidatus Handelsmanbacteria bacterium RIFCSPLOWO2_12_FULL_64_10]
MTWEEAREGSIEKWFQVEETVQEMVDEGRRDPTGLLTRIAEACAFCEAAMEHRAHGDLPLAGLKGVNKCHYCEAYASYGGCQEPIHHLNQAIADEDWEDVKGRVRGIIEMLRGMALPTV